MRKSWRAEVLQAVGKDRNDWSTGRTRTGRWLQQKGTVPGEKSHSTHTPTCPYLSDSVSGPTTCCVCWQTRFGKTALCSGAKLLSASAKSCERWHWGVVFVLRTELCGRIWGWASVIVLVGTCFIPKWTLSEKQQQKDFFLWALAF